MTDPLGWLRRGLRRRREGDPLAPYRERIAEMERLAPGLAAAETAGLAERARELRRRAVAGEPEGELAVELFALTRELARRTV
ncbi:MAG: hypothetical protein R3325_09150, partial [Thermoanaerobaculia bacterium]|nr:hypothetical protein [Thermoanaerobaculia bacterium]